MTFTPVEMVNVYYQAANRKEQIKIFCDTECCDENTVVRMLLDGGVDKRTIPGKYNELVKEYTAKHGPKKYWKKADPESIGHNDRAMEDEVIERIDASATEEAEMLPMMIEEAEPGSEMDRERDETAAQIQSMVDCIMGTSPAGGTSSGLRATFPRGEGRDNTKEPSPCALDAKIITIGFVRDIFQRKTELKRKLRDLKNDMAECEAELREVMATIGEIVAVSQECDEEEAE